MAYSRIAYTGISGPQVEPSGRIVGTMETLVYTGILVSGAIAAGQMAWAGMDRLIGRIGVEPRIWLAERLRND